MDLTINCKIEFTEAVFIGNYPKATFSHERTIIGTIIKDSYGKKTGQHTFTIQVESCNDDSILSNTSIRRKGRNVYAKCKLLECPENHVELTEEKHLRSKTIKRSIQMQKAFNKGDFTVYER